MPDRRAGQGAAGLTLAPRSFLFLQGPQSFFFEHVARALLGRGHRVARINLNLGDRLFWRLPAIDFRGRFAAWPNFVADVTAAQRITDVVLLGARRPYHWTAAEAARQRGVRVMATDLGHLRPGWLTLEEAAAPFPRDPAAIRHLAAAFPESDLAPGPVVRFRTLAISDIAYNLAAVLGRPFYPHYRRHGLYHPFAEYAGWVANAPRRLATRRRTAEAKARLAARPGSYFLFPLQLATDFQLRAFSPFADARDALRQVLQSFCGTGDDRALAVIGHPLDEGLINWRRMVGLWGNDRTCFLEGGVSEALLSGAAGMVTVNSTAGLTALRLGVPVRTLGTAIYDVRGLTHPGDLDGFWRHPVPPDAALLRDFLRALVGATQIRGAYHTREGQARALPAFVERLEQAPRARLSAAAPRVAAVI